jgi:D-inositol-3-phosphate glycosyltransferase
MIGRVAIISEHASPLGDIGAVDSGGQNVYVRHIARQLAQRGVEVDVFTRRDSVDLETVTCTPEGVRVILIPAGPPASVPKEGLLPFIPEFTAGVMRYARCQPYDLVHANFWMSGLAAAEIKRVLDIPFVITFHALGRIRRLHQGDADGFPIERGDIEATLMRQADRVIAECPQDLQDMRRHYGVDDENVSVVPCGFDPEELWPIEQQAAREKLHLPKGEPIVLQLGRMVPRKGVDTVIQSISRLRHDRGIDAQLLVVGGDHENPANQTSHEMRRLCQVALQEGVDDRVTFTGRRARETLKLYYSAADVFVTVPWYEPFGITPLEAMACGTPVIGSAVGGIKHTVADGETGFLVPPRNPDAVAERLALLLSAPDLRHEMSVNAIRRVNERFTWNQVGEMLSSVYEAAARRGTGLTPVLSRSTEVKRQPMATFTEEMTIRRSFDGAIAALNASREALSGELATVADLLADCFARGGKLLVCGNGGSAADAQHLVAELVGRFKHPTRAALPAIALTADTAVLTAWANDVAFADVFARQVEALGQPGDVLIAISTSGRSRNVLAALEVANQRDLRTVAMLGGDGGEARTLASAPLIVPSSDTQHIQEVHLVLMHVLCELVETRMLACADVGEPEPRIVSLPRKHVASAASPRRRGVRLQESVLS